MLLTTGLYFVLANYLENGKMIQSPKKAAKGIKRCKAKQLRIKLDCTCRILYNDIEEDENDRMLQLF